MEKFKPLKNYLINCGKKEIELSIEDIEGIINSKLPSSAKNHRAYFANTENHSISKAWLSAGYRVSAYRPYEGLLKFTKIEMSQRYLMSTEAFLTMLNQKKTGAGQYAISVFSLYEAIHLRGYFANDLFDFISQNQIEVVDFECRKVDRPKFDLKCRTINLSLRNVYNSMVQYALINCFVNAAQDEQLERKMMNAFMGGSQEQPLINFALCVNEKKGRLLFQEELRSLFKKVEPSKSFDDIIQAFGKLDYSKMCLIAVNGLDYMGINYLNFALKLFLASCQSKDPFIPFVLTNEFLNIEMVAAKEEILYLTCSAQHFEILVGGVKQKVIKIERSFPHT